MKTMIRKIYRKLIVEFLENLRVISALFKIIKLRRLDKGGEPDLSVVIFSKDRPLQLEALLNSYFYFCKDGPAPSIIFNCENDEYSKAYKEVFKNFNGRLATVISDEAGFKQVLNNVLSSLNTKKIFFLVDDILFKRKLDIRRMLDLDSRVVPSLRMGNHLSKSYTHEASQPLPSLSDYDGIYNWEYSEGKYDWGYPLSVDGHILELNEMKIMCEALDFKAPNSFESKLQKFNVLYKGKIGACFKESVILNIPCNKVQTENENTFGKFHQDDLLKMFKTHKIDFLKFENFQNESCHQEVDFSFIDRGE